MSHKSIKNNLNFQSKKRDKILTSLYFAFFSLMRLSANFKMEKMYFPACAIEKSREPFWGSLLFSIYEKY